MIRKRTFWFRSAFGGYGSSRPPDGDHMKYVLHMRTMRGVWGEWW